MKNVKIKSALSIKPKVRTPEQQNTKLKQAAKMYEKQFLREMMKAMRSTVKHSEFSKPGFAEKIYMNQLDNQYAEKWGDTGGIGLSNLIYEQIKERFGLNKNIIKPKGPIPLNKDPIFLKNKDNMFKIKPDKKSDDLSFIVPTEGLNSSPVNTPWDGVVKNSFKDNMNVVVEIEHDIGLTSLLSFSGELDESIRNGKQISAGNQLGVLSNLTNNLYWKLNPKNKLS